MSPEAIAGIVLGSLFLVAIIMCCVIGVISAKTKKKRATTTRQDMQADQMVYHVSNTGATSISGFPQGPYNNQYPSPSYGFNVNLAATTDTPPAYSTVYEPTGPATVGATAAAGTSHGAYGQSGTGNNTGEHIYKEAL